MSIATVLIAAAGWILAAFLCGILVGRVRDGPKEEKPKSGVARGADEDCVSVTGI